MYAYILCFIHTYAHAHLHANTLSILSLARSAKWVERPHLTSPVSPEVHLSFSLEFLSLFLSECAHKKNALYDMYLFGYVFYSISILSSCCGVSCGVEGSGAQCRKMLRNERSREEVGILNSNLFRQVFWCGILCCLAFPVSIPVKVNILGPYVLDSPFVTFGCSRVCIYM